MWTHIEESQSLLFAAAKRNGESLIHRLCEVFECASMQQSTHWKITVAQSFSNHANAAVLFLFLLFPFWMASSWFVGVAADGSVWFEMGQNCSTKMGKSVDESAFYPSFCLKKASEIFRAGNLIVIRDCVVCILRVTHFRVGENNSTKGIGRRPEASHIRWKIVYINTALECDGWFHKLQQHNTIRYGFRRDTTDHSDAMGASGGATSNEKWTKPHRNEAIINLRSSSSSCTHNILCNSCELSLNSFIRSPRTICRWLLEFDRKKCKFIYQWGERWWLFFATCVKVCNWFWAFSRLLLALSTVDRGEAMVFCGRREREMHATSRTMRNSAYNFSLSAS